MLYMTTAHVFYFQGGESANFSPRTVAKISSIGWFYFVQEG